MINMDFLQKEIGIFADIGSDPIECFDSGKQVVVRLVRNGYATILRFDKNTSLVYESIDEEELNIRHASYKALLASERFANLRNWAGTQTKILKSKFLEERMLPISGTLASPAGSSEANLLNIASFLSKTKHQENSARVLLIDGPAGAGKTIFIERLSLQRAKNFPQTQEPLILHVKSRGRVLSYLQDLIAFSLQTIRASVTYDQLPILVRHGLVQIAIDGFDELGDPNGYDNAWAQLRDLIEDIEGQGTIILAGRETFIGRKRVEKAIPRLTKSDNNIGVFTLSSVKPGVAKGWLTGLGWDENRINSADEWGLFDSESYALRPFFLSQVAELALANSQFFSEPPLVSLVDSMITREASKFGEIVDRVLNDQGRWKFVFQLLCEVARDMAENQTDSIDEDTLCWIVELVLGDNFNEDAIRILKNRVTVMAFLTVDERKGRRRFAHSEFYNYFLSHAAINAVRSHEIPKFIRRTILGTDFLLAFGSIIEHEDKILAIKFVESLQTLLKEADGIDRRLKNLGALLFASLPVIGESSTSISDIDLDDIALRGKVHPVKIKNVGINQIDLRNADISNMHFENVQIATLIADDTTRLSTSFPNVGWIQTISFDGSENPCSGIEASQWLDSHGRAPIREEKSFPSEKTRQHDIYQLLQKICRVMLRQHWIRSNGDDRATDLVMHPLWDQLCKLLNECELLVIDDNRTVGGPASVFFHIRKAREILTEDLFDTQINRLLQSIENYVAMTLH